MCSHTADHSRIGILSVKEKSWNEMPVRCKHAMRTKRAKKMQVVNRAFRKVYTSLKDYAEEYCCYTYEADRNRCGYYSNPKAFWDWYQIGGRWPYELLVKTDCKDFSIGERDIDYVLPQTPAGYMWVSAARKKDIAWDAMREWRKQQALISFAELEKAFAEGVIPNDIFGKITEKGISGFREMLYIRGETAEEYLNRKHIDMNEKYGIRPYGFLDCNGWNTHETFVYDLKNPRFEDNEGWEQQLNDFLEKANDNTVIVIVDNHN